jgi:hypothetical protein
MILLPALMVFLMRLASRSVGLHYLMFSFVAGWFLWTFTEYLFNRWLLHVDKSGFPLISVINRHHMRHHKDPANIRYGFPHPLIILIPTPTLFLLALITLDTSSFSLAAGYLFGYWLFCVLHSLQHHCSPPSVGFLKYLWQNHFLHHHRYPNKAFGVSTPAWDSLFGTLPPRHLFFNINPTADPPGRSVFHTAEVSDRRSEEVFLDVSEALLHRDPNWIPCLRPEIRSIFDPSTNPCFRHGAAKRWILVDGCGEVLGRIAAFINFKKMYDEGKKVGCIGFFECINNRDAAFLLCDTAIRWLVERYQVASVDGPVNFGENDKYWGLLVKGFTAPSYGMNYNPPYYQDLFEAYGFKVQYKQLTTRMDLRKPFPERVNKIAKRIIDNKQYTFIPFRYRERERLINDFVLIYNQAWASFKNFQPIDADVVRKSLAELKPIMDESVIWFVYAGIKAVGFLMAVPDVNEILKYAGGRFNAWGKCKFLFYKRWKGFSCLRVVAMGIVPEFQQRGLESGLIVHAYQQGKTNRRYKHVQLAWVGDFNDKMIAIHNAMGAVEEKQHATFRKVL